MYEKKKYEVWAPEGRLWSWRLIKALCVEYCSADYQMEKCCTVD